MKKQCTECSSAFTVLPEETAIRKRVSPVIGGAAFEIPEPTHCPTCRQRRRAAFRNDRHYYKNTCGFCKKSVISIYSPDKGLNVLCHTCFWSDSWDAHDQGVDFDFKKTLAEQFDALKKRTPRLCIFNTQSENSDYTVHSSRNRNCYMCSSIIDNEDIYFSDFTFRSRECMDCFSCEAMELCYRCAFSEDCYNSDWLILCFNVTDSMLCFDCKGSDRMLGCAGRRKGRNEILNKQASPAEFDATRKKFLTDQAFREDFRAKAEALRLTIPVPCLWQIGSENSTGDYLFHCKDVRNGFNVKYFEDCCHAYEGHKNVDCCDIMRCGNGEHLYDCANTIELSTGAFCNLTYQCDNLLYCDNCHGSSYCFGCFGLKKSKYCILNKQYSKEEYEALIPKIIDHMKKTGAWGEFFPVEISSFGYNETKAFDTMPLSKEEVLKRGWIWSDYEPPESTDLKTIDASRLPDDITTVPDDILTCVIASEQRGKPFRLIPQELAFYRKKGLPVPHKHPHERLSELQALQNPRILHPRSCAKCRQAIETTYAPDRPETVYCEECYLSTAY